MTTAKRKGTAPPTKRPPHLSVQRELIEAQRKHVELAESNQFLGAENERLKAHTEHLRRDCHELRVAHERLSGSGLAIGCRQRDTTIREQRERITELERWVAEKLFAVQSKSALVGRIKDRDHVIKRLRAQVVRLGHLPDDDDTLEDETLRAIDRLLDLSRARKKK